MKSDAIELIKTSCKTCIFAEYENITQTGCGADKLAFFKENNKIIEAYDTEKEFYVVKGLCNLFRSSKWNGGAANKELARQEISTTFDIIVNCNNLDDNDQKEIINIIKTISYYKDKIKLSFYYDKDQNKKTRSLCLEMLAIFQPIYNTSVSACFDNDEYIYEYLTTKIPSSYFIYLDKNNYNIDMSIINKIDEEINDKNNKILSAKSLECYIISSMLYRIYTYENEKININECINNIVNLCKEKNMFIEI